MIIMQRANREDAIAYTYVMIILAIVAVCVVVTFMTPMINGFLGVGVNPDIEHGYLTQQTADAVSWNLMWIEGSVIIAVFVLILFGVVRAFEIAQGMGWI